MSNLVGIQNIYKYYGRVPNQTKALDDASFSIDRGESVAIIGPSGCGKTTLLNVLSLLIKPDAGIYNYKGIPIEQWNERQKSNFRNKEIGFIVQDFALLENESALNNVQLPLLYAEKKLTRSQRKKHAQQLLEKVEMDAQQKQIVNTLSGGQRQRVAIARALINDPEVLLADEPTGALDTDNQEQVFQLMMNLVAEGRTLIMATHNLSLAERCSRKVYMLDGKLSDTFNRAKLCKINRMVESTGVRRLYPNQCRI